VQVTCCDVQRIGAQGVPAVSEQGIHAGESPETAESAGVAEAQSRRASIRVFHEPICVNVVVRECRVPVADQQLTGHAEVNTQNSSVIGDDGQLLATAGQLNDPRAPQQVGR